MSVRAREACLPGVDRVDRVDVGVLRAAAGNDDGVDQRLPRLVHVLAPALPRQSVRSIKTRAEQTAKASSRDTENQPSKKARKQVCRYRASKEGKQSACQTRTQATSNKQQLIHTHKNARNTYIHQPTASTNTKTGEHSCKPQIRTITKHRHEHNCKRKCCIYVYTPKTPPNARTTSLQSGVSTNQSVPLTADVCGPIKNKRAQTQHMWHTNWDACEKLPLFLYE